MAYKSHKKKKHEINLTIDQWKFWTLRARVVECVWDVFIALLHDPISALSTSVPSAAIAQSNWEVQNPISGDKQKRGPYKKYNVGLGAKIGKYVTTNTAGSTVDVLDRGSHHYLRV